MSEREKKVYKLLKQGKDFEACCFLLGKSSENVKMIVQQLHKRGTEISRKLDKRDEN
eukprot:TRINITY_DN8393_c0_g1_i1.p1 TRINITY_DN8393_c0_g1~~TRINITY_DN8393_c0_g1_i1.p1  ORF type:complete len:57 (-),score=12.71 TRINITY_DN8393_c0_g1_i1:164-334(-)